MMTAEQLKISILNLAFSGKLVEQCLDEDSPVNELHQLVAKNSKNKKIIQIVKKQDGLHYSYLNNKYVCVEESLLFEIPETWEWTSLKNVSFVMYGFPFDSALFNDVGSGVPLIRIRDVLPGITKTYTTENCSDDYIIENGDMLVGMDGNFNVNFWKGDKAYLNQRVCRIKAREEILDQKFLSFYLPIEFDRISKNVSYVTVRHLSDKHLNALFVPIPPLAEQKRIVAKIEELMPFVEQYAAASTKLNNLNTTFPDMMKKSILQEAVQGKLLPQDPNDEPASVLLKKIAEEKKRLIKEGKIKKQKPLPEITEDEIPFDIPESWAWVRLSDICSISDETHQTPKYVEKGMPFISAQNVKPYRFLPEVHRFVSYDDYLEYNKNISPEKGDILMTRVGAGIGEAAIIDRDLEFSIYVSLTLIKSYSEELNMKYILNVINSPLGEALVKKKTLGKGASQGNLNLVFIREFLLPLPPQEEQRRINEKIDLLLPLWCELAK